MYEKVVTILASYFILIPVIVSGIFALRLPRSQWLRFVTIVIIAALLALGLSRLVALLYFSPRPFVRLHTTPLIQHGMDNGFPSDHMLLAAFVASVVYIKNKKLSLVLWIVALLIGLGRILALVHSPVDILASSIIAIISVTVASSVSPNLVAFFSKKIDEPRH